MSPLSKARGARRAESAVGGPGGVGLAFCSVDEFAAAVGIGEMSVYRAIHAGRLPAIKFGGRYLVPIKALDNLVEAAMAAGGLVDLEDLAPVVNDGGA
jgi:excisionase family DNA binding protein